MSKIVNTSVRIPNELIEVVERVRQEEGYSTFTQALNHIIKHYDNSNSHDEQKKLNQIAKEVAILSELLGETFHINDINSILYGVDSTGYKAAKKKVEDRIEKRQVRKNDQRTRIKRM